MDLDGGGVGLKSGLGKHRKAEINGGEVERINGAGEIEAERFVGAGESNKITFPRSK